MRRAMAVVAAVLIMGATALASDGPAPADESFGRFKYSAMGMRTKLDALGRSYHARWQNDASLLHDAGMVEGSLQDWAQRYPRDPWLAPTALHLAQLYAAIQTTEAHAKALATYRYVAQTWPTTKEGRLARLRLHQGLPRLHAETAVEPTPDPYAVRSH